MIIKKTISLSLFWLLLMSVSGTAQIMGRIGDSGTPDIYRSSTGRIRSAQEVEIMRTVNERQRTYAGMNALRARAEGIANQNRTPRQEFESRMKSAKKYLVPDAAYRERYKSFLALPNTGIVSLHPDRACNTDGKARIKDCPSAFVYGKAKYFSFRSKDYVIDRWADLENLNGFFVSNGFDNQGILVNIGDVNLDDVTLDTGGIGFLKNFAPSVEPDEIGRQYMQIFNEIESEGFRYAKSLPIEAGKTYGLRVVAYERDVELVLTEWQKKIVKTSPGMKPLFDPLNGDRRSDVIVAFRVLEKSETGAVTIIWKELARKLSPRVVAAGK